MIAALVLGGPGLATGVAGLLTARRSRPSRIAPGAGELPAPSSAIASAAVDVFRTPDERFENLPGYPFEPHYTEASGLRMHYLDEGSGDPIVCFHGEPSWSYLYRKMLPPLVEGGHRVICPDLAGFGRSDKPTDFGWYSYDRHVEIVSGRAGDARPLRAPPWSSRTGAGRSGCAGRWRTPTAWTGW